MAPILVRVGARQRPRRYKQRAHKAPMNDEQGGGHDSARDSSLIVDLNCYLAVINHLPHWDGCRQCQ